MIFRRLAALTALGLLAACQSSDPTPYSTQSQERPAGVPQAVVSDGDIDGDDGI
ncbi:hypothetical protein [Jannaschia formosa]|uniref:hypothetical protein n=1 Tax=Jannaschia formosa TaxID=2259592 RepID=UPI00142F96EC|nr:hypothetical protein [Jannaschia formosa]